MTSPIHAASALLQRSGRNARNSINRSKGLKFFCQSPGNLATSGVAPSNHCSQSSLSECIASPSPPNCLRPSKALILGQSCSGIHSWRGPMFPGSGWTCAASKVQLVLQLEVCRGVREVLLSGYVSEFEPKTSVPSHATALTRREARNASMASNDALRRRRREDKLTQAATLPRNK